MEEQTTENAEERSKEPEKPKFDCNICFDDVKEPVVTRCGHLFCWACILSWMNRNNNQCPICQAGISKENVIPLYGHGENQVDPRNRTEEPRPKQERPSSERRQNSFFRPFDSRVTISFGAFPFSFVLPIGFGTSSGTGAGFGIGNSFFTIFRQNENSNMTPGNGKTHLRAEQQSAYTHSLLLIIGGFVMIAYLLLCA